MQVIIEIPDHIYHTLIQTGRYMPYQFNAKKAIKEGIPIQKDIDIIKKEKEK